MCFVCNHITNVTLKKKLIKGYISMTQKIIINETLLAHINFNF